MNLKTKKKGGTEMNKTIFFVLILSVLFSFPSRLDAKEKKGLLIEKPDPIEVTRKINHEAAREKRERYLKARDQMRERISRFSSISLLEKHESDTPAAVDIVLDTSYVNWQEDPEWGDVYMTGLCHNAGTTPSVLTVVEVRFYDNNQSYLGSDSNYVYGGSTVRMQVDDIDCCINALGPGEYGFFSVWPYDVPYSQAKFYTVSFAYYTTGSFPAPHAQLAFDGDVRYTNFEGYFDVYGNVKNPSSNYVTYLTEVWFAVMNSDNTRVLDVWGQQVDGSTYNGYGGAIYPMQSEPFEVVFDFAPYSQASGSALSTIIWCEAKGSPLEEKDPPFGSFDTPGDGSTVSSSIAVTGWALDDSGVANVKIYRQQGNTLVFIGDAVLVEGARPDVAASYPQYPNNTKAGWGYMLLTNFLPNSGNGTFVLHAVATDAVGKTTTLGTKTIYCDNANAVKPFGAIDTPDQGGSASGSGFVNWGWVLTPQPNSIPTNGSTINVWVDGVNLGHPTYNKYRADIASFFPGYANSNGAAGFFYLDTTAYENGVHTIQWTATDSGGNADGIGSRYFTIQNTDNSGSQSQNTRQKIHLTGDANLSRLPVDYYEPLQVKTGYNKFNQLQEIYPDDNGYLNIQVKESDRVEIRFSISISNISPLPVGSSLDTRQGVFYWGLGPGFLGDYELVFVDTRGFVRKVNITVTPK
jgi:hypothetical protein